MTLFKETKKNNGAENPDLNILKDKNKGFCDMRLTNLLDACTAKNR